MDTGCEIDMTRLQYGAMRRDEGGVERGSREEDEERGMRGEERRGEDDGKSRGGERMRG